MGTATSLGDREFTFGTLGSVIEVAGRGAPLPVVDAEQK
jgi:hypothetical protein